MDTSIIDKRLAVLTKLNKLIAMLSLIEDKEFNFAKYITDYELVDERNACGTICCVVGWMPKYIPEARFKWVSSRLLDIELKSTNDKYHFISSAFSNYLGLAEPLSNTLIYGLCDIANPTEIPIRANYYNSEDFKVDRINSDSSRVDVIQHYTAFRNRLIVGDFDKFLL